MENVNYMPFTEEELAILGFSNEELEEIQDAQALVQTTETLPEEPDKILSKIDKTIPNDLNEALLKIAEISNSDPEFAKQLVAMNEIFGEVKPEVSQVKKVSSEEMKNELVKEDLEKIKSLLKQK